MPSKKKIRLDVALTEREMVPSRAKAQAMIMAGEVLVNGNRIDKPGTRIGEEDKITLKNKPRFVSRGGEKLAGALADFSYSPIGLTCADVGASTGGFTDCLIQNGAKQVYAIDVGYGQLDYTLRLNERVVVMERTNARHLHDLPVAIDLIVIDASFISLRLLLPVVKGWLASTGDVIALIKPQFEAGKDDVGKGGIVRDKKIHRRVIEDVITHAQGEELYVVALTQSPIKGATGNIEFLVWLSCDAAKQTTTDIDTVIRTSLNT